MPRGTLHQQKTDGTRRRRNVPAHDVATLVRDGRRRGPTLKVATGGRAWAPEVVRWWETWRRSPQASVFEATDWQRLAMLAPIVEAYWRDAEVKLLAEIRMNEERLGATVTDRMRARMKITDPEPAGGLVALPSAREGIAARLRG